MRYAIEARELVDRAIAAADDGAAVPFAAPGGGDPVLVARGLALPTDPAEGATPSGITACADAAWRLFALGAGARYRDVAEQAMRSVAGVAVERPLAFGGALELMARLASPLVQLVTVVPDSPSGATPGEPAPGEPAPGDGMSRRPRPGPTPMAMQVGSVPRVAGTRHPSRRS